MPSITVSRAEVIDIGEYPPGSDADIIVVMDPVEDTSSLTVTAEFSLTRNGAVVHTMTTADDEIDVGEGDGNEEIRIKMVNADTSAWSGRRWLHVRITNSGGKDRIVLATMNFAGPAV